VTLSKSLRISAHVPDSAGAFVFQKPENRAKRAPQIPAILAIMAILAIPAESQSIQSGPVGRGAAV
jgi:hypothetical protein